MSSERCEYCGLIYRNFRTGLSCEDVYAMFWKVASDNTEFVSKGRSVVLGKWTEIKRKLWKEHLAQCEAHGEDEIDFTGEFAGAVEY